ncbi:IS110 family transposase [uncultured Parvimonas sp.]|jgi:transposase|uniref:IS110 family transposase n=1 Tax=uncultured Parvimonas sp. TaxID=747372 RepID=UPI002805BD1B|nr:IS110 family transposase [uncultured Parvimonas sp.]
MYLIGIDISKFKHDCFIATETGLVIKDSFSFDNNQEGFKKFLNVLLSLDQTQEIRIGLEATGHYGTNLKLFLHENNFSFIEFNPVLSERYRQVSSLRKTKNDKIDAKLISKMLLSYDYKTNSSISYHILKLKSLTRFRKRLVKNRTVFKERLINILDIAFPEYSKHFTQVWGKVSFYILKNYPTAKDIANINVEEVMTTIHSLSKGHYSMIKLMKLIETAKTSIGFKNDYHVLELQLTINMIEQLDSSIDKIENEIIEIMNQYNFKTATIPGIGIISAASIVSEYEDFSKFQNPNQLLSFAGLEPAIYQSGTQQTYGHMVKRGSSYLRETIMNIIPYVMAYNSVFYEYYRKKKSEGKHHRVALTHLAKKLIRIIYHLETNNISFDSSKIK